MKIKVYTKKKDDGNILLTCSGEATIYTVGELKAKLLTGYESSSLVDVDLSGISKIDTAGFQLFHLLNQEAENDGKAVRFINISSEAQRIFDLYGESY